MEHLQHRGGRTCSLRFQKVWRQGHSKTDAITVIGRRSCVRQSTICRPLRLAPFVSLLDNRTASTSLAQTLLQSLSHNAISNLTVPEFAQSQSHGASDNAVLQSDQCSSAVFATEARCLATPWILIRNVRRFQSWLLTIFRLGTNNLHLHGRLGDGGPFSSVCRSWLY